MKYESNCPTRTEHPSVFSKQSLSSARKNFCSASKTNKKIAEGIDVDARRVSTESASINRLGVISRLTLEENRLPHRCSPLRAPLMPGVPEANEWRPPRRKSEDYPGRGSEALVGRRDASCALCCVIPAGKIRHVKPVMEARHIDENFRQLDPKAGNDRPAQVTVT